jgi:Tfp pilus assembly protein PilO|tara:strand:+ start:417 stop:683 length:267 start_codon:yes stop_codon:yes gene_type:complete
MENEPWHLNKSVPLTLVFTIAVQTVALVWFISQLNSTVDSNTRDIIRVQTEVKVMERTVQTQAVSMARIDENIKAIRDAVDKMTRREY